MKRHLITTLALVILVTLSCFNGKESTAQTKELFTYSATMTQLGDGLNPETYYKIKFPVEFQKKLDSTNTHDPKAAHTPIMIALANRKDLPKMVVHGDTITIKYKDRGTTSDCTVLYHMNEIAKIVRDHVAPQAKIMHTEVQAFYGSSYRKVTCPGR